MDLCERLLRCCPGCCRKWNFEMRSKLFEVDELVDLVVDKRNRVTITVGSAGDRIQLVVPVALLALALPSLQNAAEVPNRPDTGSETTNGRILGVSVRKGKAGSIEV